MILRKNRLSTIGVLVLFVGCGTNHESPLPRLEQDYPVNAEMLRLSNCRIDGIEVDDESPIQTKYGKPFVLTGNLESGKWNTKSITTGWGYDPDYVPSLRNVADWDPVIPKTAPKIELYIFLHGNDTSKFFGVIESIPMQARPVKRPDKSKMEFRVTIKPPKYRGHYVIDLQAVDEHAVPAGKDDPPKLLGSAIWRRELWVE